MKIRVGYVSNSSSSSFIVYGIVMDYDKAVESIDTCNVYCIINGGGASGDVADFVFKLTHGRLKKLNKKKIDISNAMFIDVLKEFREEGITDIDKPLRGGALFDICRDDSSPCSDSDNDRAFAEWIKYKGEKQ